VKVVARRVLKTFIESGKLAARMDASGAQWEHNVACKGMLKEMMEGRAVVSCYSLSTLVNSPPFKAEEGCSTKQPKDLPRNVSREGEHSGKRRRTQLV
jgi:hypothetical protein